MKWLRQQIEGDLARWSSPLMCEPLEEIRFRVADCEAKLAIIAACLPSEAAERAVEDGDISVEEYVTGKLAGQRVLQLLASAYRHRPGYEELDIQLEGT